MMNLFLNEKRAQSHYQTKAVGLIRLNWLALIVLGTLAIVNVQSFGFDRSDEMALLLVMTTGFSTLFYNQERAKIAYLIKAGKALPQKFAGNLHRDRIKFDYEIETERNPLIILDMLMLGGMCIHPTLIGLAMLVIATIYVITFLSVLTYSASRIGQALEMIESSVA